MAKSKKKKQKAPKSTAPKAGGGLTGIVTGAASKVLGGATAKTGRARVGGRRRRGPTYWANKVLVEKLKRRYYKIKFSGAGR